MTEHRLYEVAHEISRNPHTRITGSLARSAIMAHPLMDDTRADGTPRNVNVLNTVPHNWQRYGSSNQTYHGVDISTQFDRWIRWGEDGSVMLTHPSNVATTSVEIENPEEVFQPFAVKVGRFTIQTLAPEVLGKVTTMMQITRPKDMEPFSVYQDYLSGQTPVIDQRLLKPFDDFAALVVEQNQAMRRRILMQRAYQKFVPTRLRDAVKISHRLPGFSVMPPMKVEPYQLPEAGQD